MNTPLHIKKLFSEAWGIYKKHWLQTIGIIVLAVVVIIASQVLMRIPLMLENIGSAVVLFILLYLVVIFISIMIDIGLRRYFLGLVDGHKKHIKDLFHGVQSFRHAVKFLGIGLVVGIFILVGTLLIVIPGIILALGFMFIKYVAAENKLGFFDAIKYSWNITKGYKWKLLGLCLLIILFNILGVLALGIGLLITMPMTHIIFARAFRNLEHTHKK